MSYGGTIRKKEAQKQKNFNKKEKRERKAK
jgi:hypothetical protein